MSDQTLRRSNRNDGIDTLRILSMLMIVTVHIFTQGGVLSSAEQGSVNWYVAWALRIFFICDVNCFALISGYVSVDSRFHASRVVHLWLQVFVYSVSITAVFRLLGLDAFQPARTFFPILSGRWWYMTAYFGIVFIMPYIGRLFDAISRKQASMLVCVLIGMYSLLPTLYHADTFKLHSGYSMTWLMALAVIGGYIKRYDPFPKLRKGWLGFYILFQSCICAYHFLGTGLNWAYPDRFVQFTSIFTLLGSICLIMLFARTNMRPWVRKVTSLAAPTALGVYLIHVHPSVWNHILSGRFATLAQQNTLVMLVGIFGGTLAIFVLCSLVDWIRAKLFHILKIDKLADCIGAKLTHLNDRIFQ